MLQLAPRQVAVPAATHRGQQLRRNRRRAPAGQPGRSAQLRRQVVRHPVANQLLSTTHTIAKTDNNPHKETGSAARCVSNVSVSSPSLESTKAHTHASAREQKNLGALEAENALAHGAVRIFPHQPLCVFPQLVHHLHHTSSAP